MFQDTIKITGSVRIKMFNENNELVYDKDRKNTIMTVGRSFLAAWLQASSQAGRFMPYIGLGEGDTAPTINDTTLEDELDTRVINTATNSSNVLTLTSTFGPGVDTGTITEAGLFSAETDGTMFARQVFQAIDKGAGNTLVVAWSIAFS